MHASLPLSTYVYIYIIYTCCLHAAGSGHPLQALAQTTIDFVSILLCPLPSTDGAATSVSIPVRRPQACRSASAGCTAACPCICAVQETLPRGPACMRLRHSGASPCTLHFRSRTQARSQPHVWDLLRLASQCRRWGVWPIHGARLLSRQSV